MNIKSYLMPVAASLLLAGCGGGVSTPDEVRGTWSTGCPTGTLSVDANSIHILYPKREDFTLTASEFDGRTWKASFENGGKKITDSYILENGTLRVDTVTVDGNSFSGDKTKLTKCE